MRHILKELNLEAIHFWGALKRFKPGFNSLWAQLGVIGPSAFDVVTHATEKETNT